MVSSLARRLGPAGTRRGIRGSRVSGAPPLFAPASITNDRDSESANWNPLTHRFQASSEAANWLGNDTVCRVSGKVLAYEEITNLLTHSSALNSWTNGSSTQACTFTTGQPSPDGGTTAVTVTDAQSSGTARVSLNWTAAVTGHHTARCWILKDDVAPSTRVCTIVVLAATGTLTGGSTIFVNIDTQGGAYRTVLGTAIVDVIDAGDWWHVVIVFHVATTGTFTARFFPATGAGLDATGTTSTQGSVTTWGWEVLAGIHPHAPPVRTSGATATRDGDALTVANADVAASLFSTGFRLPFVPLADASADTTDRYLLAASSTDYLGLPSGEEVRLACAETTNDLGPYGWRAFDEAVANVSFTGPAFFVRGLSDDSLADTSLGGDWSASAAADLAIGHDGSGSGQPNALIGAPLGSPESAAPEATPTVVVYAVMGQSNAMGADQEANLTDQTLLDPLEGVLFVHHLSTQDAGVSEDLVSLGDQAFSVELTLAREILPTLAAHESLAILKVTYDGGGLVTGPSGPPWLPTARGGPGSWTSEAKAQWSVLLASAPPGARVELRALAWLQGETDATHGPATAEQYGHGLVAIVKELVDHAGTIGPRFRVITPGWHSEAAFGTEGGRTNVTNGKANAATLDPRISSISGDVGELLDGTHYDADSLMLLGEDLAAAFLA